jgi:hypothetical protein
MKKRLFLLVTGAVFILSTAFVVINQNARTEAARHPRIVAAINNLEDAIVYMEKAPDNFGGHKARAIADSRKAVESLKRALQYRANVYKAKRLNGDR